MSKYISTSIYTFLNENKTQLKDLYKIAKGVDYDTFLYEIEDLSSKYNILYRGQNDDILNDNSFMTDYIRHAKEYGDDVVGIIHNDKVMYFDNTTFNKLRDDFVKLLIPNISPDFDYDEYEENFIEKLNKIYKPYFDEDKLCDAMYQLEYDKDMVVNFVYNFMVNSAEPYKKYSMSKQNDFFIPLLMYYAKSKNVNIISFLGGDYADYGGQDEFVVGDISKYTTLKSIWLDANNKSNKVLNENNITKNNYFFVQYNTDRFVSHITSKKRETEILKNGFKTGFELDVSEKRKAIYFSDKDVNYGIYARNKEGETNYGDDIGEVTVNLKGLKLLNLTYKENNKFPNHAKYNNFSVKGELDTIPYNIDGTISFLKDGRIYEVALKKEVANKRIK